MTPPFFGHDEAAELFLAAMASGRMHHAWLLAGPQGVGKARFADAAALRLLAEAAGPAPGLPGLAVDPEHRIARLMAAGSHPDFQRLERLERETTGTLARNISVDQVRGLSRLFATTPTFSERRVVVIDAADDLERSAANALLKSLEEPPTGTVFLLVSHAPGRLLPTIRSRCRVLRFRPLEGSVLTAALRVALPEAAESELAGLAAVSEGSPGKAAGYVGLDVAGLDRSMTELIREGDPGNGRRGALARSLSLKAAQPRYQLFLERAPARIADEAKRREGPQLAQAIALWGKARSIAAAATPLSLDPQATAFEMAGLLAALAPAPLAKAGGRR